MPITVFSKSVSGYNRREVDEYIANMNRAFVRTRRDYEKKIEILEAEAAKLRESLEKASAANTREEAKADAAAQESAPDRDAEAEASVDPEISDIAEKSRRYDELSQKVGEILMNANAEASQIVREADEKVKSALTGTMSTLRNELTSVISKLTELLESAEAELSVECEDENAGENAILPGIGGEA